MKKRIAVKKELLKQVITVQNTFIGVIIGVLFTVINVLQAVEDSTQNCYGCLVVLMNGKCNTIYIYTQEE